MAAAGRASLLVACLAILSFIWLSHSIEKYPLLEQPRISSFLLFFVSGLATYCISLFSPWLPSAVDRFDDKAVALQTGFVGSGIVPRRPRRFFLPAVVALIVLRLELYQALASEVQCSSPGVESILPLLLLAYEQWTSRKTRTERDALTINMDPTLFEEFTEWMESSRAMVVLSAISLTYGVHFFLSHTTRSTFFCSSFDNRSQIVLSQYAGIFLDVTIITMLWRLLVWSRTTKARLQTVSIIMLASSFFLGCVSYASESFAHRSGTNMIGQLGKIQTFRAPDVAWAGAALSSFGITTMLTICEDSPPSTFAALLAFLCGLAASVSRVFKLGTYENTHKSTTALPLYVLCLAFILYMYASSLRFIAFIPRGIFSFLLFVALLAATVFALLKGMTVEGHPLEKLIYDSRIEADRWLVHATISKSLKIAVAEYKQRNYGRSPPPAFDQWYNMAVESDSVIVDRFDQIRDDLLPFWGANPQDIRQRVKELSAQPGIAIVKIENGNVSHNLPVQDTSAAIVDDLIDMARNIAQFLPDMELPVNMLSQPRVIVPWEDMDRFSSSGRHPNSGAISLGSAASEDNGIGPAEIRDMVVSACSASLAIRSGGRRLIRDFCSSCANPQSTGQFLLDADKSLDLCHQPDLLYMHGYHLTRWQSKTWRSLVPVFSRSKTASFADILLPVPPAGTLQTQDTGEEFTAKAETLYWRGKIGEAVPSHELVRGGQQERLAHLIRNASTSDQVTVMLPTESDYARFAYENVKASVINDALPFDIGISDYRICQGNSCDVALREFGMQAPTPSLSHRYVLLVDDDQGPASTILTTVRSTSVPFIATMFRQWYTERLLPWVHYVPVDLRYHGLHSTLAYFTGLLKNKEINGREVKLAGRIEDAQWIADQGRRWAGKALRPEDMQLYLFRLLLEWGRIIDDNRDELGFVLASV